MNPSKNSIAVIAATLSSITLSLTACGGGSGASSAGPVGAPGASVTTAGVWKGTLSSTTTGQSSIVVAMTDTNGHSAWMTTDGRIYDGSMPMSGDHFQVPMRSYLDGGGHFPDGTSFGNGSMMVDTHTSSMMSGRFSGNGDAGTFDITLSPMWNRSASLGTAAGTYTRTTSTGYAMTMTIGANGQVTGSDSAGCTWNGTVSVPDASHNLYRMDATVTSCGALDGAYHGMGSLFDADAMQDWMSRMPGHQHGGMMGGGGMMGHNTMPSGQHNLFMFSLVDDHGHAMMDALAR